jgi:hypothetical protein
VGRAGADWREWDELLGNGDAGDEGLDGDLEPGTIAAEHLELIKTGKYSIPIP